MKGKIKSIFIHIINAVITLVTGFLGAVLLRNANKTEMIISVVLLVVAIIVLAAEIILIVYQAKHKYGKVVFISGLMGSVAIILGGVAAGIISSDGGEIEVASILAASAIGLAGVACIVLHSLIRKDNLAVATVPAPKKVIAEEKVVKTQKPAAVKKASTKKSVTKNKPTTKKKK